MNVLFVLFVVFFVLSVIYLGTGSLGLAMRIQWSVNDACMPGSSTFGM